MKFISTVIFLFTLIPMLFLGWIRVLIRLTKEFIHFIVKKQILFRILFFTTLLQLFFSIRPWIEYQVDFVDTVETIQVSVKSNLIIILCSLFNFISFNFFYNRLVKWSFLMIQVLLCGIYFFGLLFPEKIYTDFINSSEYHFHNYAILFGLFCGFNTLFGFWNWANKTSDEVLD